MSLDVISAPRPTPATGGNPAPAALQPQTVSEGDVHLWRARLDQPSERLAQLARLLSPDEQARAARFRYEPDRTRFLVARGLLRVILAAYLDRSPEQLHFAYGLHGKPALDSGANGNELQFNLAHADGVVAYAVTRDREVGIDLERVRPFPDMHQVAARCFSLAESSQLRSLPAHLQASAFFNAWTRKEAVLKAIGEGVATAVRRVEVSLLPGEPARVVSLDHDRACGADWMLRDIDVVPGFAAALAAHGANLRLVFRCPSHGEDWA